MMRDEIFSGLHIFLRRGDVIHSIFIHNDDLAVAKIGDLAEQGYRILKEKEGAATKDETNNKSSV